MLTPYARWASAPFLSLIQGISSSTKLNLAHILVEQDKDMPAANHALEAINKAIELLKTFPFTCRKAKADDPFLREMIISLGANGYVALFDIEEDKTVTMLAVRHQRADDYR